jgi:phage I-like protein
MKKIQVDYGNIVGDLVVLRAEAGDQPKWNRLFPLGFVGYRKDFEALGIPGGKIEFTREYLETMLSNWERHGKLALQVNYLHRGDTSPDGLPLEEKVAAGWIEDFELRADGLYGLIKWTKRAKQKIDDDELRYLSPEFYPNGQDRSTGKRQGPTLIGCALLNDPFITQQQRVAAANNPNAAPAAGATEMDRNKLIAILSLAANATDEDITKALEAQKAELAEAKTKLSAATEQNEKLELSSQGSVKLAAEVKELREQNVSLTSKVAAMEAKEKTAEIDTYVTKLVTDGKMPPAQVDAQKKLARLDFAAFKEAWDKAPVVVKMGERGITGEATQTTPAEAKEKLTALTESIRKEKGISLSQAREMAITQQPELAKLAFRA